MDLRFTPGATVRVPAQPDWGQGRVQSALGSKLTVDFEHRGKLTLDVRHVTLELIRPPRDQAGG